MLVAFVMGKRRLEIAGAGSTIGAAMALAAKAALAVKSERLILSVCVGLWNVWVCKKLSVCGVCMI